MFNIYTCRGKHISLGWFSCQPLSLAKLEFEDVSFSEN